MTSLGPRVSNPYPRPTVIHRQCTRRFTLMPADAEYVSANSPYIHDRNLPFCCCTYGRVHIEFMRRQWPIFPVFMPGGCVKTNFDKWLNILAMISTVLMMSGCLSNWINDTKNWLNASLPCSSCKACVDRQRSNPSKSISGAFYLVFRALFIFGGYICTYNSWLDLHLCSP